MKRLLGIFMICLMFIETFFLFGGYMLLDFRYGHQTIAFISFLSAILINILVTQAEKIEVLEERIKILEQKKNTPM